MQKTEMGTDKVLMPGEGSQKEAGLVSVQWGLGRKGHGGKEPRGFWCRAVTAR